jgi:hypothetical protein
MPADAKVGAAGFFVRQVLLGQAAGPSIATPWEKPRGSDQSAGCRMRVKIPSADVERDHLIA